MLVLEYFEMIRGRQCTMTVLKRYCSNNTLSRQGSKEDVMFAIAFHLALTAIPTGTPTEEAGKIATGFIELPNELTPSRAYYRDTFLNPVDPLHKKT